MGKNPLLKILFPKKKIYFWIRKWIFYISPAKNSNPKWYSILKYSYYVPIHTVWSVAIQ
jgi:hypothetical protein